MSWDTEEKIYRLKYPIRWGDEEVKQLAFRPIKSKDLIGLDFDGDKVGSMVNLSGKICKHESGPTIVKELHFKDLSGVTEIVNYFLDDSPETGSNP